MKLGIPAIWIGVGMCGIGMGVANVDSNGWGVLGFIAIMATASSLIAGGA